MSEETGGMMFSEGQGIAILPREEGDIREYVRALEWRVTQLEAQMTKMELASDGYSRFSGYDEDAAACTTAECQKCGHVGLRYEAWKRRNHTLYQPNSYHAFGVCPKCDTREEF